MRIDRNDEVARFILERQIPGHRFVPPFSGFVVHEDGRPAGAYVLNCFTGHDVEISVAVLEPWSIGVVRAIAQQCFQGLGVARVTAKTRASNMGARAALMACGFRLEVMARDFFGDENAAVYVLLKREQKLLRNSDGLDAKAS